MPAKAFSSAVVSSFNFSLAASWRRKADCARASWASISLALACSSVMTSPIARISCREAVSFASPAACSLFFFSKATRCFCTSACSCSILAAASRFTFVASWPARACNCCSKSLILFRMSTPSFWLAFACSSCSCWCNSLSSSTKA